MLRTINLAKAMLTLDAPEMNELHELKESHIVSIDRYPTRPSINDIPPEQDYPAEPLEEAGTRHIQILERDD